MKNNKEIKDLTKHYLEAYKITNEGFLEEKEVKELDELIEFYNEEEVN